MSEFKFDNNFEKYLGSFLVITLDDICVIDGQSLRESFKYIKKHSEISVKVLEYIMTRYEDVIYGLAISDEVRGLLCEYIDRIKSAFNNGSDVYELTDNSDVKFVFIDYDNMTDELFDKGVEKIKQHAYDHDDMKLVEKHANNWIKDRPEIVKELSYIASNIGYLIHLANINTDIMFEMFSNMNVELHDFYDAMFYND